MSERDPQATTGQQPNPGRRCTCGDPEAVHVLDEGVRKACSRSGCRCRAFIPVADAEHRCPTCGVHIDAIEAARITNG